MNVERTIAALTFVINELTEEIKGLRAEIEELKEMQDMEIVFTPEENEEGDDSIDEAMDLFYSIFDDTMDNNTEEGE